MKYLLAQSHLSVITRQADYELTRIQDRIQHKVLVDGRSDLEELLGRLLDAAAAGAPIRTKTLDLIGHSIGGKSLLQVGDWVIDRASPTVTAFFRELSDQDVLSRLGIHAIRLLGCQTADTGQGRATITTLSDIVGLEVFGTTELIYSAHYDETGFRDECRHALVCASDLRRPADDVPVTPVNPYPRTLDVDALPVAPLTARTPGWPRRLATTEIARRILRMVRRKEGAHMPGLLAAPSCEVALPAVQRAMYHGLQILLGGEFIRVYPDGDDHPGVVYPVDDPHALCALIDVLPLASV
jgi:hypothetical protein